MIRLTKATGGPVWVRPESVDCIAEDEFGACVQTNARSFYVKEPLDEVVDRVHAGLRASKAGTL